VLKRIAESRRCSQDASALSVLYAAKRRAFRVNHRDRTMAIRHILAGAALLASGSAWAQAAPAEQSSDDLVCQLADTCETAAEAQPEDTTSPAPTTPGGPRVTSTRGFKIARQVEPKTSPRGTAADKAQVVTPGKRATTAPGKARKPAPGFKVATPGRADLRLSFVTGSAELTEAGQREALKFMQALGSPLLSGMRFTIEGHTDAVGSRESNLDLSKRRAQAVVDYLVGKGADRSRFEVAGYGYDKPLPGLPATAAANRRVEVVRIKK
jgi:OmpA-OmpF porin, OOP family